MVHIRRTDYLFFGKESLGGKNMCLPDGYFINCLNKIKNINDYLIIFISDDIIYARKRFSNMYFKAQFESNDEIIDFQLLMYADVLVISNSTFAWWAAYLNQKPNKIVYAPKYWLGFKKKIEYPVNILHPNWIVVEVKYEFQIE